MCVIKVCSGCSAKRCLGDFFIKYPGIQTQFATATDEEKLRFLWEEHPNWMRKFVREHQEMICSFPFFKQATALDWETAGLLPVSS